MIIVWMTVLNTRDLLSEWWKALEVHGPNLQRNGAPDFIRQDLESGCTRISRVIYGYNIAMRVYPLLLDSCWRQALARHMRKSVTYR